MCQTISEERFRCGHIVKCHLKHSLNYCKAPNGIPFTGEAELNRRSFPRRACSEEKWVERRLNVDKDCPECAKKPPKPYAGVRREYQCGHSKISVFGHSLQDCFPDELDALEGGLKMLSLSDSITAGQNTLANQPQQPSFQAPAEAMMESSSRGRGIQAASLQEIDMRTLDQKKIKSAFSWEKFENLQLLLEEADWPCPECYQQHVRQYYTMYPDPNMPATTGGYRAKKPKGLGVRPVVNLSLPGVQR